MAQIAYKPHATTDPSSIYDPNRLDETLPVVRPARTRPARNDDVKDAPYGLRPDGLTVTVPSPESRIRFVDPSRPVSPLWMPGSTTGHRGGQR